MTKFKYKGYCTHIHYNQTDKLFYGKIEGINDLVNFESDNMMDIENEFHKAVDTYIDFCGEVGKSIQGEQTVKPELGTTVYCIYDKIILIRKIACLLEDRFLITPYPNLYIFDILEWAYEDKDKWWFTDINKAKAKLKEIAKANGYEDFTIAEDDDMLYIVEESKE